MAQGEETTATSYPHRKRPLNLGILGGRLQEAELYCSIRHPGVEGGLPYGRGGDARRKFLMKPPKLKETNLGVAQPFLHP